MRSQAVLSDRYGELGDSRDNSQTRLHAEGYHHALATHWTRLTRHTTLQIWNDEHSINMSSGLHCALKCGRAEAMNGDGIREAHGRQSKITKTNRTVGYV